MSVMLVLFFLFALFRHLQGAPIAADNCGSSADALPAPCIQPRADVVFGTRTTSDIVASCLATSFACTWTAIHPNIPSPADSRWNVFKRQLVTTLYALLAPEFITLWALRQYVGSKRIVEEYNREIANQTKQQHRPRRRWYQKPWVSFKEWLFGGPSFYPTREGEIQPWTITHGFFVQMGGFVLSENGMPIQVMSFSKTWLEKDDNISEYITRHNCQQDPCDGIKESILAGIVDAPKITRAEINDRSKGDLISKIIVILQTTWFITQCIARWATSIPVTELEIITLGFAMLNGITYALWWHKPQNIGVPVYLEAKTPLSTNYLNKNTINGDKPLERSDSEAESSIQFDRPQMIKETASSNQVIDWEHLVSEKLADARLRKPAFLARKLKKDWNSSTRIELFFLIPYRFILGVLRPLNKLKRAKSDYVHKGDLRVPIFFAEPVRDLKDIVTLVGVVAALFGGVHLVPSFFLHYLSHAEMWLWRISAAFITFQPVYTLLFFYARDKMDSALHYWIEFILDIMLAVSLPLYIVARLALIILALVSLRHLPDNARRTIDWISSIPHL